MTAIGDSATLNLWSLQGEVDARFWAGLATCGQSKAHYYVCCGRKLCSNAPRCQLMRTASKRFEHSAAASSQSRVIPKSVQSLEGKVSGELLIPTTLLLTKDQLFHYPTHSDDGLHYYEARQMHSIISTLFYERKAFKVVLHHF